jgi:glycosyltransferase involved in cell wall biosynthesis
MKLLVLPRDPNPYQELLYREMRQLGATITYLGALTPSRTLNLILLPLETWARRITGARLIHLHWVFGFGFPGARRFPVVRRAAHAWFLAWLRVCRMADMRLIWTAHNVLPHEPVFADDEAARRELVAAADLVLAHSASALSELAALGALPRRSAVIPHGPVILAPSPQRQAGSRPAGDPRRFLFLGRVCEYKGVEDLLSAFSAIPADVGAHLTVAGPCEDANLRSRLRAMARSGGTRVTLRLERVSDHELAQLLASADVVVLPFRRVTTSGSAMLALSHGRPLILPELPGLADLPDQAVLRYDGGIPALTAAVARLASADPATLATMSAAAYRHTSTVTWLQIAERTMAEMRAVLDDVPGADLCPRPARAS